MMATGFERDIDSSPARSFACLAQRIDFRMRLTCKLVPPRTDDLAFIDDDATDTGIRGCSV